MTPAELYRAALPVVRREARRWPAHVREDVEQEVWAALMDALPSANRAESVTAWARAVVVASAQRAIDADRLIRRPGRWAEHERRVARLDARAMAETGEPATGDELAEANTARLTHYESDREPASLDSYELHEAVTAGQHDPERDLLRAEEIEAVRRTVDSLCYEARRLLRAEYGLDGGGLAGAGNRPGCGGASERHIRRRLFSAIHQARDAFSAQCRHVWGYGVKG